MAGNAHKNRLRNKKCSLDCVYCKYRAGKGKKLKMFRNKNGHRHNPAANKKQKKN